MDPSAGRNPSPFTLRAIIAGLFGILISSVIACVISIVDAGAAAPFGDESIPLPGTLAYGVIALVCGGFYLLTRARLLEKGEMLVVIYMLLIASPLLTSGFWRPMYSSALSASAVVQPGKLRDELWPHGRDLLKDALASSNPQISAKGNVSWQQALVAGVKKSVPVLTNKRADETSALLIRIPLRTGEQVNFFPGDVHALRTLFRAAWLGSGASYSVKLIPDGKYDREQEILFTNKVSAITRFQPEGFTPTVTLGVTLPDETRNDIGVQIELNGEGELLLGNIELIEDNLMAKARSGRQKISRENYEALPEEQRSGLAVMPASLFSMDGARFLLDGWAPFSKWLKPVGIWAIWIALLLAACYALAALFRRKWVDAERFPLPMARIPVALAEGQTGIRSQSEPIYRSFGFRLGVAIGIVLAVFPVLRAYFPSFPVLHLGVELRPYFPDGLASKFVGGSTFYVAPLALAIGLLMEINVAASLVVGYFIGRLQVMFGYTSGLNTDKDYPFHAWQSTGAFLAYALLILGLSWRYLRTCVREIFHPKVRNEVLTPGASLGLLALCLCGVAAFALWLELPPWPMLLFFTILLLVGFAAMRIRAECGLPGVYMLAPAAMTAVIPLVMTIGGMDFFGSAGFFFVIMFGAIFINSSSFWAVPGIQTEWLIIGHRLSLKRWQVAATVLIAGGGALVIGGMVYLNTLYGVGMENFPIVGHFSAAGADILPKETLRLEAFVPGSPGVPQNAAPPMRVGALIFGAAFTTILVTLRQAFAGFWFHPVGFLVAGSQMTGDYWGSLLAACVIRFSVLKIGGAGAVRKHLTPFAIGLFAAIAIAAATMVCLQSYHYFFSPTTLKFNGRF